MWYRPVHGIVQHVLCGDPDDVLRVHRLCSFRCSVFLCSLFSTHTHTHTHTQQKLDVDTQVQGLSRRLSSTQSELNTLASEHTTKCQELVVASQLQEEKHRECQDFQEQLTALQEEYEQYKRSYSEGNQYKM